MSRGTHSVRHSRPVQTAQAGCGQPIRPQPSRACSSFLSVDHQLGMMTSRCSCSSPGTRCSRAPGAATSQYSLRLAGDAVHVSAPATAYGYLCCVPSTSTCICRGTRSDSRQIRPLAWRRVLPKGSTGGILDILTRESRQSRSKRYNVFRPCLTSMRMHIRSIRTHCTKYLHRTRTPPRVVRFPAPLFVLSLPSMPSTYTLTIG